MRAFWAQGLLAVVGACLLPIGCGSSDGNASNGSAGAAGQCLAVGVNCTSTPNACCSGVCANDVSDPSQPAHCAQECTAASQCASGCCATLAGSNKSACGPRGFCPDTCVKAGGSCSVDTDCCLGAGGDQPACISANGGGSTCADKCVLNTDCVSRCCVPVKNAQFSVCSAPQFCG